MVGENKGQNSDGEPNNRTQRTEMAARNFRSYYERQLQLDKDDFAEFISALDQPLPITFRLVGALQGYEPDQTGEQHAFDAAQATVDAFHQQLCQVWQTSFHTHPAILKLIE